MTALLMGFLLLVAGLLQDLIPGWLWFGEVKAPCLLALVVYYALHHDRGTMLACALLAGLIQDSLSLMPIGYSALCFSLIGLLARMVRRWMLGKTWATAAIMGGVASLLATALLQAVVAWNMEYEAGPGWWIAVRWLGSVVSGAVVTPFIWFVAGRLDSLVGTGLEQRGNEA